MIDLIIILVLSAALVPLAGFSSGALRIVLGLVFVLFSPGYTLIAALFPRKTDIGGIERVALSFGLSIAVVPLIGLALNYTPWGIRLWPVLLFVLAFIYIASGAAWYRRRKYPVGERFSLEIRLKSVSLRQYWSEQGRWDKVLSVLLVVAILATIGTLGYVVAKPKVGERFTEFYILGPGGKMENYPGEIVLGQSAPVITGIANHEHQPATYRVEVIIDGQKIGSAGPVTLEHEEEWEGEVKVTPVSAGEDRKAEFLLFKDAETEPYRTLHLWIDVREKE